MLLRSPPIHISNENGGLIRVRYVPKINWPPLTASKIHDPNEHPIFVSNLTWGWLQDHFHLKQCRTTLKDGWARGQRSIWRPIGLWSLAWPSLRVVLHCFRIKCSWGHPQSIFQTKMGGSLGSGMSQRSIGLHWQPPKYMTLMNTQFLFQILLGGDFRIIST